jgi:hypothetical protein
VAAAFTALKTAVTSAPVLALPDFTRPFVVECDASTHGFGAMLLQDKHPIAFFSHPVAPRHRSLAAYERELIGLVHAIRHWRPYLWGRRFTVRTDHYSLKFLLDQRLATIPQHHWVGKLLGFDFEVEYKPGAQNTVADALSRQDTPDGVVLTISAPRFNYIERLRQAHALDPTLVAIRDELAAGTRTAPWGLVDGLVTYDGRLYIPPTSPLLLVWRSWPRCMGMDMRACSALSTDSDATSTSLTCVASSRTSFAPALRANASRRSICNRLVFFFHYPCRLECGLTSGWTSSRLCPGSKENPSS